ncbi:MAG: YncE family protein, partial [Candidatus Hydrogenedentes bacterium]|nr:YncE family protein [Candidatus Hydrogenedentota bacterium]
MKARAPKCLSCRFLLMGVLLCYGIDGGIEATERAGDPNARVQNATNTEEQPVSRPSRFGVFSSQRWAYGRPYERESLAPVKNPNPRPEPQPTRDHPFDVAISGDGSKVYVGLQGTELQPGNEVAVYDVASDRVTKRIRLIPPGENGAPGLSPYRLTAHPGGRFLLVTNRFSNFASVIDMRSDTVVSEIPLDFYCQGVAFDRAGRTLYVANRYLDQAFVVDVHAEGERFDGSMRILGGLDADAFLGNTTGAGLHSMLARRCGTIGCHDALRGGFVAGADPLDSFSSVIPHVSLGNPAKSRLLRAVLRSRDGGYADAIPKFRSHAAGTVVFPDPRNDTDYQSIADWIAASAPGPGIPVANVRSKPKVCVLSTDGRYLYVGNTG